MEGIEKELAEKEYPAEFVTNGIKYVAVIDKEKRKAFIKGYQKANEWISVDTPPKEYGAYLCYYDGELWTCTFDGNEWIDDELKPTHWQHITPPKK